MLYINCVEEELFNTRRYCSRQMNGLRAQGLLPQAFVPHKPQFTAIQLIRADASEAEDYCC